MSPEQKQATSEGIENALISVPPEIVDEALRFWYAYAKLHYRFTSAQVLVAFLARKGTTPGNGKGWRDCWGSICVKAKKQGIMQKVGIMVTTEKHTHMGHGAYWQSKVYEGGDEQYRNSPEQDLKRALYMRWLKKDYENLRDYTDDVFSMGVKFALENKDYVAGTKI